VGAIASFSFILFYHDFWTLLFATFVFSFFWNAILPQFESLTLAHLEGRSALYSRIRVWGSVGFIVMVLLLGVLFDRFSVTYLPWCLWLGMVLVVAVSCFLHSPTVTHTASDGDIPLPATTSVLQVLRKPTVMSFFAAIFLLQLSHGVYYGFYTLYLQDQGFSRTVISILWALGVVAEIVLFLLVPRIFARFSLRQCLLASVLLASARWALIALVPHSLPLLALAQLAHAFTFGMVHAVAMSYVKHYFNGALQGRGQALYSAFGFGAGAAAGTLLAGMLWPYSGALTFLMAAFVALLAFVVVLLGMPRQPCLS
jgi:PPP family 3-phenylpropionic acid transporter